MGVLAVVGSLLLLAAAGGGAVAFNVRLANRRLADWFGRHGTIVVAKQVRWVRQGPFTFRSHGGGRIVYRLHVRNPDGVDEYCWAACPTTLLVWDGLVDVRPDGPRGFPIKAES